jgi:MSHA biogenesis protein MshO
MKGFTLVELVIAIVIIGILGAVAAMILVPAFDSYFASQRRAQMAEVADTAMRRMTRDIRLALPNSPRVDATSSFLEILMTKNGGRYRALNDDDNPVVTTENPLDFSAADSVFDTLGSLPTGVDQTVAANDYVVIHNLGIAGANAYDIGAANRNIAQISAFANAPALANEDRITLTAATQFPLESPGRRFFVVSGPVTYACTGGSLLRWSGYAIQLNGGLPPTVRPVGATEAVLAANISACNLTYTTLPQVSRGLVGVRLAITRGNETVTLYYEAHVNNVP